MLESDKNIQQEFFAAIRRNDLDRVNEFLKSNSSLANVRMLGDATLLNDQIWVNKKVVPIEAEETRDAPALHYTVFHNHIEMAKLLLDYGADIHAIGYENNHEMTQAIVIAAWEGGIEMLKLLLEYGADPNAKSSNNVTPLSTAIKHGFDDRIELLKKFGATK